MKGPRIVRKKAIDAGKDSYLLKIGPDDRAECKKCGAVYHSKRWTLGTKPIESLTGKKALTVLCPACQKIRDNFAGGYITIRGDFLKEHRDEILNLIRNKELVAMRYNPLDRIIEIKAGPGAIDVTTTTEKLAQRIGQMMKKSYGGTVAYKWSGDVKLARIIWSRQSAQKYA